jgi:hypothetical protein
MNRCRPSHRFADFRRYVATLAWLMPLALLTCLFSTTPLPADALPAAAPAPALPDALSLDKKLIEEAKHGSELMANLTELSDGIGARLTGSAALKKANEWAAEKMKGYGLTDVHLEGWTIPVGWQRGAASLRVVEPEASQPMTVAAMGWTASTPGKITGEVVVLTAKNSTELAPYQGKLKGAIVLQGPPTEMRPVTETAMYNPNRRRGGQRAPEAKPAAKSDAKTEPKTEEAKEAAKPDAKQGAKPEAKAGDKPGAKTEAGVPPGADGQAEMLRTYQEMIAFRRELREFLRTEGAAVLLMCSDKPHGLLNMTGSWPGNDRVSGADPVPSLFVVHEHYSRLYRLATRSGGGTTRAEVEIHNTITPGPIPVYNTVGEIRGLEKPDEYVVLGAHIDSWDLAQGTTDNGTGTCVVLEAARILSKGGVRPKRTIRFCLFSGEEQGLHGSRAFVKQHQAEMPKTSMALVHDTGTGKVNGIGLQGRESVKTILEPEFVSLKELGCTDINLRSMPGSDHMSFEAAAVPGFAVQQDWDEYRFTHHSQSDTLDKAKEPALIQGAQVLAVAALRVANLTNLLPHDKPPRKSFWDNDSKPAPKDGAKDPKAASAAEPATKEPAGSK